MKDISRKALEQARPSLSAAEGIAFCLERLFDDQTRSTGDEVVAGLTYEELIGALLLARDTISESQDN